MRISNRWRKHAEVYRLFAEQQCRGLDFSERAALEAFDSESNGAKHDLARNGFAVGKHWANVQATEWRAGVEDGLFRWDEFAEDPELASIRWWVLVQARAHLESLLLPETARRREVLEALLG